MGYSTIGGSRGTRPHERQGWVRSGYGIQLMLWDIRWCNWCEIRTRDGVRCTLTETGLDRNRYLGIERRTKIERCVVVYMHQYQETIVLLENICYYITKELFTIYSSVRQFVILFSQQIILQYCNILQYNKFQYGKKDLQGDSMESGKS